MAFDGVRPRVDVCRVTNPHAFVEAAHRGLHYVAIVKIGTIASATNWESWQAYTARADWITSLLAAHKLRHNLFEQHSAMFNNGNAGRKREWVEVKRTERAHALQQLQSGERYGAERARGDH